MSAGRICSRVVAFATPDETVRAAARRMVENNVGALPVLDAARRPIGILTDRDIVLRVVAGELRPDATRVGDVMTRPIRTVPESTAIEDALRTMKGAGIGRLIVLADDGSLAGLLSVDDVMALLAEEVASIAGLLRAREPTIAG